MLRQDSSPSEDPPNALASRMRRRIGRLGAAVGLVIVLAASLVVFAICACRSVR